MGFSGSCGFSEGFSLLDVFFILLIIVGATCFC
ncbi:YjcZ family sporulation protein [Bacillus sp. CH126_4D]|nr:MULTISPECIES: YjcZ family sporulation protein [unclassified Bacillus (in: firmicutes)]KAB2460341.1 YjcZ family sporulation protein [Bacillus sp. CH140a_4T]KAB2468773.1 YjcZ family sporulation protein [Bacillus sp. CH126_4D]